MTVRLLERPALRERSDSLDVLRAMLALWVVVVHLAEWGPLSATGAAIPVRWIDEWTIRVFQSRGETHPAVLVFIVLSGYCIHRAGARRSGAWSSVGYAIKRFFRIWPVYVLASVFGAVVFLFAHARDPRVIAAITGTSGISVKCMAAKLAGVAAFAPSATRCSYQGNAPLATVMVEMWLYVAYGIVVWLLLRRRSERALWLALFAITIAGFVGVAQSPAAYGGWWNNSSLAGFLPYWWIGAAFVARPDRRNLLAAAAFATLVWAVLTATLWRASLGPEASFLAGEARKLAFAVAAAGAIVLLDTFVRRLPRLVASFGRSGYSLYALHAPILIAFVAFGLPWWAAVGTAVVVAVASYRWYERPLLVRGRAIAAARLGTPAPVRLPAVDDQVLRVPTAGELAE